MEGAEPLKCGVIPWPSNSTIVVEVNKRWKKPLKLCTASRNCSFCNFLNPSFSLMADLLRTCSASTTALFSVCWAKPEEMCGVPHWLKCVVCRCVCVWLWQMHGHTIQYATFWFVFVSVSCAFRAITGCWNSVRVFSWRWISAHE